MADVALPRPTRDELLAGVRRAWRALLAEDPTSAPVRATRDELHALLTRESGADCDGRD